MSATVFDLYNSNFFWKELTTPENFCQNWLKTCRRHWNEDNVSWQTGGGLTKKISYIEELLEASLKCNFICLYWLTSGGPFKRVVKIVCHYVWFLRFCRGFKAAFAGQRRIIYVKYKAKGFFEVTAPHKGGFKYDWA